MFDFIRLGHENYINERSVLARFKTFLLGHLGLGYGVKLYALKSVLPYVKKSKANLLDVGCSNGMYTFYINKNLDIDFTLGIDGDEAAIEDAKRVVSKNPDQYDKIQFQAMRFEDLPSIGSQKFDLIMALDSLYYTPDGLHYLDQLLSLLADDGELIVSFPHLMKYYGKGFSYYTGDVQIEELDQLYKKDSILRLLQDRGFQTRVVEYPSEILKRLILWQREKRFGRYLVYPFSLILMKLFWRGAASSTHFLIYAKK